MKNIKVLAITLFLLLLFTCDLVAQSRTKRLSKRNKSKIEARFSFLAEAEYIRSQVDGDFLKGYDKAGYMIGGGVQYRLNREFALMIDLSFNSIGSMKDDPFLTKLSSGTQLDLYLKTIAPGFAIVLTPVGKKYAVETGFSYHKLVNYDYSNNIRRVGTFLEDDLDDSYLKGGFMAVQFKIGYSFVKNLRFYGKYNHGFSSLLKRNYINIHKLQPYWLSFGVYYLIYA